MNMNDKIAESLKTIISQSGQPLAKVCRDAEVNQPAAYKFISRTQERIALDDLIKFAKYFRVPIQAFWENGATVDDVTQSVNKAAKEIIKKDYDYVKFFDVKVSAGTGLQADDENSRLLPIEKGFLQRMGYHVKCLSAVEVAGDSMEPTLKNGDYVIVLNKEFQVDFVPGVYVIRDISGLKVKRLDVDKNGALEVASDNKYYKTRIYTVDEVDNGQVTIIGRVIGKIGVM